MTRVAGESAPPRQSNVLKVGANTALNVAAVATFVPCLYLLWLGQGIRDWREWAIYAVALGLWCIALLPVVRRFRAGISTIAASLILASPLIIAPLGGPGWVIIGVVSFAIIVGAIFNFSTRLANIVLIFVAALDALEDALSNFDFDLALTLLPSLQPAAEAAGATSAGAQ